MKKSDLARWNLVCNTAEKYARAFGLRLRRIKPLGSTHAGQCDYDGTIFVSLRDKDGLRKSYFVLDTIAHELAHLAFFNHRTHWVKLFSAILTRMADDKQFDKFRRKW